MSHNLQHIYNLDSFDLQALCQKTGSSLAHAKTITQKLYKFDNGLEDSSLPKSLKEFLHTSFDFSLPTIVESNVSKFDNSIKFLLKLHDGQMIESVLMPEKTRVTLCLSSQVGCKRACSFCHTGRMGLIRNLSTAEIVSQLIIANRWMADHPDWLEHLPENHAKKVTNIVFMGMGEPLDNFDAVVKAIRIFTHPNGFHLGPRKISVSSSGHVDGLRKIREIFPNIPLAISLHATNDKLRRQLMPITREWPLAAVLQFIDEQIEKYDRKPLIQYTLIHGVNDRLSDAEKLVEFFADKDLKINLIPFNTVEPSQFQSSTTQQIKAFRDVLHHAGIRSLIRYSKGQDINAACGQLVNKDIS